MVCKWGSVIFCQINSNLFQQPCWSICLFLIKIKSSFEAFNFLEDHNKVGDKNRLENDIFFVNGTKKGFHWIVSSLFDWKVQSFEMLQSGLWVSLGSQGGRVANTRSYDADKLMYETLGKLTHSPPPLSPPSPPSSSERLYFHRTIIKTLQYQLTSSNRPFYQSVVLINKRSALLATLVEINQQPQTHF